MPLGDVLREKKRPLIIGGVALVLIAVVVVVIIWSTTGGSESDPKPTTSSTTTSTLPSNTTTPSTTTTSTTTKPLVCDKGWALYQGFCYFVSEPENKKTWYKARSICEDDQRGNLASVHSVDEYKFIGSVALNASHQNNGDIDDFIWTGGEGKGEDPEFKDFKYNWVDRTVFSWGNLTNGAGLDSTSLDNEAGHKLESLNNVCLTLNIKSAENLYRNKCSEEKSFACKKVPDVE